jgi:hypothetical protein
LFNLPHRLMHAEKNRLSVRKIECIGNVLDFRNFMLTNDKSNDIESCVSIMESVLG